MEKIPFPFIFDILNFLSQNYLKSYTLEQITQLIFPLDDLNNQPKAKINIERQNQAEVLEALVLLSNRGYIFLDTLTDESLISFKGLIKIKSTILSN